MGAERGGGGGEGDEDVKRGGKKKKISFQDRGKRDAFIAVPSHDPEIGNSKGSSEICVQKTGGFTRYDGTLLSLTSPLRTF